MSSMTRAERVLPEPEMQLKRMKPGTSKVELTLNTRKGSMQAAMVGASLVKMPTMGVGNIHRSIHKGTMDNTAMRVARLIMGTTASRWSAPRRLEVRVEAVEANATRVTNMKLEMARITLVAASSREPKCSTAMKKTNHVVSERKFCTIVQMEILSILPSRRHLNLGKRWRANL